MRCVAGGRLRHESAEPTTQTTRSALEAARADTVLAATSPVEYDRATAAFDRAEKSWRSGADEAEVDRQAFLAQRQIELATTTGSRPDKSNAPSSRPRANGTRSACRRVAGRRMPRKAKRKPPSRSCKLPKPEPQSRKPAPTHSPSSSVHSRRNRPIGASSSPFRTCCSIPGKQSCDRPLPRGSASSHR